MDDVSKLKELCIKYNTWLHLSGDNLSGLALISSKTQVNMDLMKSKCSH